MRWLRNRIRVWLGLDKTDLDLLVLAGSVTGDRRSNTGRLERLEKRVALDTAAHYDIGLRSATVVLIGHYRGQDVLEVVKSIRKTTHLGRGYEKGRP